MKNIYLVMSEELLDDEDWQTDACRAFTFKREAEEFMTQLRNLYRENRHIENPTRFFIKSIPFGLIKEAA